MKINSAKCFMVLVTITATGFLCAADSEFALLGAAQAKLRGSQYKAEVDRLKAQLAALQTGDVHAPAAAPAHAPAALDTDTAALQACVRDRDNTAYITVAKAKLNAAIGSAPAFASKADLIAALGTYIATINNTNLLGSDGHVIPAPVDGNIATLEATRAAIIVAMAKMVNAHIDSIAATHGAPETAALKAAVMQAFAGK